MPHARQIVAGALIAVLLLVPGCALSVATRHPAARTVGKLLELRAKDVRDAKAYAPYFEQSELATALAEGTTEPTGTRQVPEWKRPYVSEETTDGAMVVVVWKKSAKFPDWPLANIFTLLHTGEHWVVVDAVETSSPLKPIKRSALKGE